MNDIEITFPLEVEKEYIISDTFLVKNWRQIYDYLEVDNIEETQRNISFSEGEKKYTAVIANPVNMYLWMNEDEDKIDKWEVRRLKLKERSDEQLRSSGFNSELISWIEDFTKKHLEVIYVLGKSDQ